MSSARVPKEEQEVITINDSDDDDTQRGVPQTPYPVVEPEVINVDSSPPDSRMAVDDSLPVAAAEPTPTICATKGQGRRGGYEVRGWLRGY